MRTQWAQGAAGCGRSGRSRSRTLAAQAMAGEQHNHCALQLRNKTTTALCLARLGLLLGPAAEHAALSRAAAQVAVGPCMAAPCISEAARCPAPDAWLRWHRAGHGLHLHLATQLTCHTPAAPSLHATHPTRWQWGVQNTRIL